MSHQLILAILSMMVITASAASIKGSSMEKEGKEKAMLSLENFGLAASNITNSSIEKPFSATKPDEPLFIRYRRDEISDYEGWEN